MRLALSLASSRGVWVVVDASGQLKSSRTWEGDQSEGLQSGMDRELAGVLSDARIPLASIESFHVVTGPGAFTGLRIAASYLQGVARALGRPVWGIPTWQLFEREIYLPLQHQKTRHMTLEETFDKKLEWLRLSGPREYEVVSADTARAAATSGAAFKGLGEDPFWPSPQELASAVARAPQESVEIIYGLEPKISGQRQA